MEVMNVYPFASGGRAAARRYSKDEAGVNDPTVAAGFSCSPDERQRHPRPAAAPHIAIAHAGYGVHENALTCRNPLIPFVLRTQNAINPGAPPDAPYHHRLRKLARPRQGTGARHASALGA